MRHSARIILISILIMFPTNAKAGDWDKYMQFTDRFYNLDKQEFESISCNIEAPITKNQVQQLQAQFEPLKGMIEVKENLADFRLIYAKDSGLNIHYPSFDIRVISEAGIADPAKVKKGLEMVNAGIKRQIEGTAMQLQGLFEGFETPQQSQYKMKEIKGDKATYIAKYDKEGSNFTEVYSNKQRKIKQITKNGDEISSSENYKNIANNKLLLTDAQTVIINTTGKIEMNMTISYEKIKDVIFPTHIEGRFKQSIQTLKQEGQIDIYLKNCSLR